MPNLMTARTSYVWYFFLLAMLLAALQFDAVDGVGTLYCKSDLDRNNKFSTKLILHLIGQLNTARLRGRFGVLTAKTRVRRINQAPPIHSPLSPYSPSA
ncbi:hypothetical protein VAR608DRAFT_3049 [Variovorax sp. HW608]|uniref:hypothetical protein n=1 Tax=Variovorax sp. HW608 TaxID=1034889 RepID=UPI00081FEE53|nr:hypothetical protein [Variovorax sp. HW608]SCK34216.1 hypothetical protein VAR608DRAFT_3049 [Variovorax sp. HW608]